jgi:uncharacterized protein YeaO (DUF488 family)
MAKLTMHLAIKRVYEAAMPEDGKRVLIDRLWPRGISRARAQIDFWLKEVAPSDELRRWYGHDPEKFSEFRRRYEAELAGETGQQALEQIHALMKQGPVTLVFAARDQEHSNAAVLHDLLLHEK